jgi:hypothetical protein
VAAGGARQGDAWGSNNRSLGRKQVQGRMLELGAQFIGVEQVMGGALGEIKGHHQWWLSTRALQERKRTGRRHLLEGKWRGG